MDTAKTSSPDQPESVVTDQSAKPSAPHLNEHKGSIFDKLASHIGVFSKHLKVAVRWLVANGTPRLKGSAEWLVKHSIPIGTLAVAFFAYQVSRSQKQITADQNRKLVDFHVETTQRQAASLAYVEIRDILQNPQSSVQAQVFALRRCSDAMAMRVESVRDKGQRVYPNVRPIRALLLQFIRSPRTKPPTGSTLPKGAVSDELVKLLHKLGPAFVPAPHYSRWELLTPTSRRTPPERADAPNSGDDMIIYDLSYLPREFFVGANLPYLFFGFENVKIRFPFAADFGGAVLNNANLLRSDLRGATFSGCDIFNAKFDQAMYESQNLLEAIKNPNYIWQQ